MKRKTGNKSHRIVDLLETYENRDFFYDRARNWENSPLRINDELIA